jgi:hypothetical protein
MNNASIHTDRTRAPSRFPIWIRGALLALCFSSLSFARQQPLVDSRNVPVPVSLLDTISVHFVDVPIREALQVVARKGNFNLNYNEEIFDREELVTYSAGHQAAFQVLKSLLEKSKTSIIILNKRQVVLVRRKSFSLGESGTRCTLSGFVTDLETGEALVGANVYFRDIGVGTAANAYGFYSITVPPGEYILQGSYLGYTSFDSLVELGSNTRLDVRLKSSSIEIDTVMVIAEADDVSTNGPRLGIVHLNPEKLGGVPVLFGEQDLLKVIQFLPGVSNPREGDCGIYVRGGDADQNLILLDEATIYSPFHTFGLFSIFNSDAIKSARLMKGTAPARFGGRLSSVIDMQMKEGNMKEFNGLAGIGLIFSRLMLQGPLQKDKASFLISGRRTYLDMFGVFSGISEGTKFRFYDLNAKINYKVNETDRFYVSGYFGSDGIGFSDSFDMTWGNTTGTIRWNHLFSDKLFLNTSFILSSFKYELDARGGDITDYDVRWLSEVTNLTVKSDFEYFHDASNTLGFGGSYIRHSFLPAQFLVSGNPNYRFTIGKKSADEFDLYVSHEYRWAGGFRVEYGLRASLFSVTGDADDFNVPNAEELDVDFHGSEEKTYIHLQPRISAVYVIDGLSSLKAGYSRNTQYLHMLANVNSGTPIDVWQPCNSNIKPGIADQVSLGYFRNTAENEYDFSAELYYKNLSNQIDYKDGANYLFKNYFDSELVFGRGWSYGLELFARKNLGSLTGWISYTVSTSKRAFDRINNGRAFFARNDKTHELSTVAQFRAGSKWLFSANFVLTSGFPITLPYGTYSVFNEQVLAYTDRNGYRLPSYHRLDLGVSYTTKGGNIWNFMLYNATGRRNIYTVLFRDKEGQPGLKEAVKLSLFPAIPSLSYTFTF